ncbi:bacteriocin [Lactobacillus reuteri]|uniref:Blp family class II bacteriocin n=1 Tax=Lactobacillaceae TaxID=33958 RepID=UPI00138F640C|nr:MULTISPECIES: Blp family class II bacteriocin [Lactobacillaceae]NDO56602.1 bacteriocin [Limosilactobacillus reuteri]
MKKLEDFQLKQILGGKNSWQQNVYGSVGLAVVGVAICGLVGAGIGGYVGYRL